MLEKELEKENAPGYEPRAKNENSAEDVIFYPHYSIMGRAGEIEYTPDQEAAAEYCDLQAQRWHTRAELHRLEMRLEAYGEQPNEQSKKLSPIFIFDGQSVRVITDPDF